MKILKFKELLQLIDWLIEVSLIEVHRIYFIFAWEHCKTEIEIKRLDISLMLCKLYIYIEVVGAAQNQITRWI
jgi:hypothetical protein